MKAFRYSINSGETGGIVMAINSFEAKMKIARYHEAKGYSFDWENVTVDVWEWSEDDYYCPEEPDVFNCY